ncbi:MAG: hypothetical protein QM736_10065 [Vicinamibacterales bacterium]
MRSPEGSGLLTRLLMVVFFVEVGLLLMVLPWSSFWTRNYFVYAWPALEPLFSSAYFRGGVTGVGLLNLVAGFGEMSAVFGVRE